MFRQKMILLWCINKTAYHWHGEPFALFSAASFWWVEFFPVLQWTFAKFLTLPLPIFSETSKLCCWNNEIKIIKYYKISNFRFVFSVYNWLIFKECINKFFSFVKKFTFLVSSSFSYLIFKSTCTYQECQYILWEKKSKFRFPCKLLIVNSSIKSCIVPADFNYWKVTCQKPSSQSIVYKISKWLSKHYWDRFRRLAKSSIQISYRLHTNKTAAISACWVTTTSRQCDCREWLRDHSDS